MTVHIRFLAHAILPLLAMSSRPQQGSSGTSNFSSGLNLPPQQGSSGTGCFMPGVYNYAYSKENVAAIRAHGFTSARLPVNIATALDADSTAKLREYIDAVGGHAVLCMFGTQLEGDGHGTGKVDDVQATTQAWRRLHEEFGVFPNVKYEIFNEPFGYTDVSEYYRDVSVIVEGAHLPIERCIVAGMGYESELLPVVKQGWTGDLGYHFYPTWVPEGSRTQENFSNKVQSDLAGVSSRVWITEFGGALNLDNPGYEQYEPSGEGDAAANVNCLRGLHDGLLALKSAGAPVRGAFHWHGWHNEDSYDFWSSSNGNGATKVKQILHDLSQPADGDTELVL